MTSQEYKKDLPADCTEWKAEEIWEYQDMVDQELQSDQSDSSD